nr:MAG: nonstructural protein [Microviridae sp.]
MIMRLYVMYDSVANEAGPIYEAKNRGVALRSYQQAMLKCDHPTEFLLYEIGTFDHESLDLKFTGILEIKPDLATEVEE